MVVGQEQAPRLEIPAARQGNASGVQREQDIEAVVRHWQAGGKVLGDEASVGRLFVDFTALDQPENRFHISEELAGFRAEIDVNDMRIKKRRG
jgi:hypothetical protein